MALFNKIFSSNKRKNVNQTTTNQSQFPFNNEQVRVLLYRECDWRGRRLLFDSSAVQCVPLPKNTTGNNQNSGGYIEICDGFGYKYCRPNPDCNNIGEMVFGAVAMSYRGTSLKVHWLQSPTRVLCSQVFLSPVHTRTFNQSSDSNNTSSDVSSIDTNSMNSFSLSLSVCLSDNVQILGDKYRTNPLDVPSDMTDNSYMAYSAGDSGYSGTDPWNMSGYPYSSGRSSFGSMFSDQESLRKLSIDSTAADSVYVNKTSDGSLHRRILKNMSTSFENKESMSDLIGFIGDNYNRNGGSDGCVPHIRRNSEVGENHSNPEMKRKKTTSGDTISPHSSYHGSNNGSRNNSTRRAKLGLAVCITLNESVEKEMQIFCSEHIALLESMLCRLRITAENAYKNRQNFIQIMLRAWHSTTLWIRDLFTAPRLSNPVWLTLSCGTMKNPDMLAHNFMSDLSWLLTNADTKDTNFFISSLLTAILTNHLGWVGTVAPISTNISATSSSNIVSMTQQRTKISEISKSHPYSALWAQIGDLYGSIGNPPKISKTIICGRNTKTLEKILNVLTYFIRCGEIKREFKEKIIEKNVISDIMQNMNEYEYKYDTEKVKNNLNKEFIDEEDMNENNKCYTNDFKIKSGLSRTSTCIKNLSVLNSDKNNETYSNQNHSVEALNEQKMVDVLRSMKKNVMNDIPNVLVYRDSRFVRQELRIGNFLMDTGIEMNPKLKKEIKVYQKRPNEKIKLTITSPDNVEFNVTSTDLDSKIDFEQELKINGAIPKVSLSELITANSLGVKSSATNLLWGIEPIKVGKTLEENKNIDKGIEIFEKNDVAVFKRSHSLYTKSANSNKTEHLHRNKFVRKSSVPKIEPNLNEINSESSNKNTLRKIPSLSDLITANNIGHNPRLLWGVEPSKEAQKSLELIKHFEKTGEINELKKDNNEVVFVLGDDEALINIKTHKTTDLNLLRTDDFNIKLNPSPSSCSLECAAENHIDQTQLHKSISSASIVDTDLLERKMCKHKFKKHSGVKFNFEQYPQIATNYMKNKNLDISNYNFLEKGQKIEQEMRLNYGASTSNTFTPCTSLTKTEEEEEDECDCCRGENAHILTTPSNASELEFSSDITENNYQQTNTCKESLILTTPTNATELECYSDIIENRMSSCNLMNENFENKSKLENTQNKTVGKIGIIENNCDKQKQQMKIINIPLPKSTSRKIDEKNEKVLLLFKPGFIPSLFTGISDHYIPDMVLQGTYTPPTKWESSLKHDLVLASHCAILEQTPTENIGIIANTDKWDVRVISSQTSVLPSGNTSSGLVGMSQLVASMLETVHAMWSAGTSAYHCMSFMESKLQEIYFQSETLAAFLLATEFCSLNTLTSALNLSANDVPFLLSVASVHSPQVTKKYGVSFR